MKQLLVDAAFNVCDPLLTCAKQVRDIRRREFHSCEQADLKLLVRELSLRMFYLYIELAHQFFHRPFKISPLTGRHSYSPPGKATQMLYSTMMERTLFARPIM